MPRTLIALAMAAALAACAAPPPTPPPAPVAPPCPVKAWLALQGDVQALDQQAAVEALVEIGRPADADSLYHYGLLNQQLQTYGAWVQARDSFKSLLDEPGLSAQQRSLVQLLLQYNQDRINRSTRTSELLQEEEALRSALAESEAERALLEQKIEALTDIETAISTRKAE